MYITEFARLWSKFCDKRSKIYYKTSRHLESYFNILEDRKKYGDSVLLNIECVQEITRIAQNESRIQTANPIPCLPRPQPQDLSVSLVTQEVRTEDLGSTNALALIAPAPTFRIPTPPIAYQIRYLAPAASPLNLASRSSSKKTKNKRTYTVRNNGECGGKSKRFLCKKKCGKCELESCTGKYNISPCINIQNN